MDGNNRTTIIDVDTIDNDAILSLTLDYQAQVLYWVFIDYDNRSQTIKRSNIDGTNQQTILQLRDELLDHFFYFYILGYSLGLTVYNETLFLSVSRTREMYKLGTNGENFTLFINNSAQVFCRFRYNQLKVTNQPSG